MKYIYGHQRKNHDLLKLGLLYLVVLALVYFSQDILEYIVANNILKGEF